MENALHPGESDMQIQRRILTSATRAVVTLAALIVSANMAIGQLPTATAPNGYLPPRSGYNVGPLKNITYQPNSQYQISATNTANPLLVGYNQPVMLCGQNIGEIKFDYAIWTGNGASGTSIGGAAIAGQFIAAPNFKPKAG